MDKISAEKRSLLMQQIKSEGTTPERIVRSCLHGLGFRFRLYRRDLPGKPDIVLPKYKVAIQVRGCFWHFHNGCKMAHFPKSNIEYWTPKLLRNIERDKRNDILLGAMGWNVIVIWECEVKDREILMEKIALIG